MTGTDRTDVSISQVERPFGTGFPLITTCEAFMSTTEVFDLSTVEDVETAEVQLKRNGQPLPIFVTLAGPEHPKRKRYAFDKQRKIRKQLAKTGKMEFGDPQDDEAEENDLLADCILDWRGVAFQGQPVLCNRESVMRLLTDKKRAWFRKSLLEAFNDLEAFTRVSAGG